jgi:hypothetical protein
MNEKEIIKDFIKWYYENIDGPHCDMSITKIVDTYIKEKPKRLF